MTRQHIDWLLDWETRARNPASVEWVMGLRPSIAPQCLLLVQHCVHEGRFAPRNFALSSPSPFDTECRVEPWLAAAISRCDGRKTVQEHLLEMKQSGQRPADYQGEDFAAILITLVSAGILTIA